MVFVICFLIAFAMLIISAVKFLGKGENKLVTIGACLFTALFIMFIPAENCTGVAEVINNVVVSIVHSIRVFGLNEDFFGSEFDFGELPLWFNVSYVFLLNLLYMLAPMLTFGLILSVFGDIYSCIKLLIAGSQDIYIFSEANTRSEALAEDIRKNKNAAIVFFGTEDNFFCTRNRIITFADGIIDIKPFILRRSNRITFFVCGDDEAVNLETSVKLLNLIYDDPKCTGDNMELYFFSTLDKSVLILNSVGKKSDAKKKVTIRRINEPQNFVYSFIYERPVLSYKYSKDGTAKKAVNIAVAGLGKYGEEYLRAAVWSGQDMDCKLNISVFEKRNVKNAMAVKYPELVNTDSLDDKNEINYSIDFYDGTDIFETRFEDIPKLKELDSVLVVLGDDELNFRASVYLRECFGRMGAAPDIYTVISDIDLDENMDIENNRSESYNIIFLSPNGSYTYDKVTDADFEKAGKEMNRLWSAPKDENAEKQVDENFYNFEYCYRSSIAASLFWKIRKEKLGIEIKDNEENLRLEHRRWNAYMRSEGYRYGKRNDIAKLHPNLVSYNKLPDGVKEYDAYPIRSVMDKKAEEKQ